MCIRDRSRTLERSIHRNFHAPSLPYHTHSTYKLSEQPHMHLRVLHMAEHGSREHRTGTSRHTLQPLAAEIGTPSRPSHPTCRISCKSLRHVDMPSRRDELLAVDTAACGPAKGGIRVSGKRAPTRLAQRWVLWRCAARAAGVCCAGWCGGVVEHVVEALPGTREWVRSGSPRS